MLPILWRLERWGIVLPAAAERQRAGDSGFTQIAEGVTDTNFDDSSVAADTSYTYRVRACNAGGCADETARNS